MYKPLKRFMTLALAFAASMSAGFARDVAATKGGYNKKENGTKKRSGGKSARKAYVWGTLGLSAVSAAIQKDRHAIISRKERRQYARDVKGYGAPFKPYYNGKVTGQR